MRLAFYIYQQKRANDSLVMHTPPEPIPQPTPLIPQDNDVGKEFKTMSGDMSYIKTDKGCWECNSHAPNAYGYSVVSRQGKLGYAHRLSYEDKKGPIGEGMVLRHTCDNRRCINPDHLIPGTQLENIQDRVLRGRSAFGESNGRAKLKEDQVKEILADLKTPKIQLARKYGVDAKMIRNIKNGINWAHLQNASEPVTA